MIFLTSLGDRYSIDKINNRFRKADEVLKIDGLTVALKHNNKNIDGLIFLPTGKEIGNFTISKNIHSHPFWDYVDIPQGPQITWFNIYKNYRGKGISTSIYEGLVKHFGALYSDHSQTKGGVSIWLTLVDKKDVHIYQVRWRKKDWKIVSVNKSDKPGLSSWSDDKETQIILLAVPKQKQIQEFKISHAQEIIQLSFTKEEDSSHSIRS